MKKSEFQKKIASRFGLSARDADEILKVIVNSLSQSLVSGSRVEIRGFGSFYAKDCKPYVGRNPRTGEKVMVKAKRLPCFRQSKEMKSLLKREHAEQKPPREENPSDKWHPPKP